MSYLLCFQCITVVSEKGATQVGYKPRGHLIRELLRLLRALDTMKAKTVRDISDESGMGLRQAYRWLKALEEEKMVQKFEKSPARYRLKPIGTRLRRSVRSE
jgi:DNA-binding IclR family transcriptional regulator